MHEQMDKIMMKNWMNKIKPTAYRNVAAQHAAILQPTFHSLTKLNKSSIKFQTTPEKVRFLV